MITPDDDIADFRKWLEINCTALLPCKSQWEKARWSDNGETFVMYQNKRGKVSWSSEQASRYWDTFCADEGTVLPEAPANVPAPTEAFVLLPESKVGMYAGADLNTADGRWIASIHRTGYDNKLNADFEAVGRLLAAAPETLHLLREAHRLLSDPTQDSYLTRSLISTHITTLENP